jgi:histidine ammonia-lyase
MIELGEHTVTLADLAVISRGDAEPKIGQSCRARIDASRAMVMRAIEQGEVVYGVTTGFGALSNHRIDTSTARELQANLLRSHATGTGDPLPASVVRVMLVLRAHALAHGYSGVRPIVIQLLIDLYRNDILPVVPTQGSVGASGDLAPLAHLSLPLIGEGRVDFRGQRMDAAEALRQVNIEPIMLEPKEALALINGTQTITAVLGCALVEAWNVLHAALRAGAMTVVARHGRIDSFDSLIQNVRPHPGQQSVARYLRDLLEGWDVDPSVERPVQDRYSLRALPQVLGAVMDTLRFVTGVAETEINSVTDNPLFFEAEQRILSGANFHGHPVALAADHAKTAMASLTTNSERRVASLVDPRATDLPAFLAKTPGVNSGLMILHYVAASIVSENRVLAHPASVDSLSTSADVEDYNSMGTLAARNLRTVVENASRVVAIELICAAQAIDLGDIEPKRARFFEAFKTVRERVPFQTEDAFGMGDWIDDIAGCVRDGSFNKPDAEL